MPTQADFERVLMNPIFAMGAGLFSGGPNAMMNAYQLVQSNARSKREAQEHEEMMSHRRIIADNEREKNRLYGMQVEEQAHNRNLQSAQAAESRAATKTLLKQLGLLPDDAPVQPNAPAEAAPPMETASPGFENLDAYAAPVKPQTQLIPGSPDAPRPQSITYQGSPEKVAQQHSGMGPLSPQGKAKLLAALTGDPTKALTGISAALAGEEQLRRQAEADKRAEANQERAERNQSRAEAAAMRSQQHLDLSLARFNAQLQGKPAASAAAPKGGGGSKGGIPAPKPAKVAAAEVKRADAVKQGQEASRQVDVLLDDLSKNYENLHKMDGAISDPKKGLLPNLRAYAESSPPGQLVGRAVGSKAQGERDKITSTKPLLMASIAKATGVKATQLNSNRELEFYLNAATDPNKNIEVNREAIMRLREMFGSAESIAKFRSQFPADALEGGAPAGNGGGGALSAEEQKELEELRKRFKK